MFPGQGGSSPVRTLNLGEKAEREDIPWDEQELEIDAGTIQGDIERDLERQRRQEEESTEGE